MSKGVKEKIIAGLLERNLADKEKLENLFGEKQHNTGNIVQKLIDNGIVDDRALVVVLSEELNIPPIDISRMNLKADNMRVIPEKLIQRHKIVPLARIGDFITVVVSDPTDVFAIDDIKTVTGCDIALVLAPQKDLNKVIRAFYEGGDEQMSTIIDQDEDKGGSDVEVMEQSGGFDVTEVTKESTTAPIVKMVDLMIGEAVRKRASDIHVEPQERSLRVRYRVDGELLEALDIPKKSQNAIIARIKIMSSLDITETRLPQDGRFRIKFEGREIDLRVSILPTTFGNKVVMRTLDKSNLSVGLESLGFLPRTVSDFKKALSRPFGIILVTGPTGSGKSTTLYSILTELNTVGRNIVTVEDPVEYQVQGITQIATKADIGFGFASGLRAILRQSPDIIMVGEIRDFETADIAIKASLTGQLVLSTLHTNDAVGAITRLTNMGIEPFLISSSLIMACAQRLMRKICPHCRAPIELPKKLLDEIRKDYPEADGVDKFFAGQGCSKCGNSGYRGRIAVLETVLMDDTIREMVNLKVSDEEIKRYLRANDVRNLRQNAMTSFFQGNTTIEEVLRVT